jgi:hypothetical protein
VVGSRRTGCWCGALLIALAAGGCARKHSLQAPGEAGRPAAVGGRGAPEPARVGAKARARLEPLAPPRGDNAYPFNGEVTFSETADGVDAMFQIQDCVRRESYPVAILEGGDCSPESLAGAVWDSPRGEGIPNVVCTGQWGGGRIFYTRAKGERSSWTIGTPRATDLLGHALVIYDARTGEPLACGTIERSDDVPAVPAAGSGGPPVEIKGLFAGLCLARMIVRDNAQECPKPAELVKCAAEHCELEPCLAQCRELSACLEQQDDMCRAFNDSCIPNEACGKCQSDVMQCALGFCLDEIACAPPITPDGPCAKLEACCAMQGDQAQSCLDLVYTIEKLSGDPSCFGVMHDWDHNMHLPVPCKFQ